MKSTHPYCEYVATIRDRDDVDKLYHDNHYGVRIENDNELFGRFLMEINQAGLSWRAILKKENGFRKAYANFNIKKIATYTERDIVRLMNDETIIRNKLKICAVVYNAREIVRIQKEYVSFRKWLDVYAKELKHDKEKWVKLFKKHFKFVGGEIVGEFLTSIAVFPHSHSMTCSVYTQRKRV